MSENLLVFGKDSSMCSFGSNRPLFADSGHGRTAIFCRARRCSDGVTIRPRQESNSMYFRLQIMLVALLIAAPLGAAEPATQSARQRPGGPGAAGGMMLLDRLA